MKMAALLKPTAAIMRTGRKSEVSGDRISFRIMKRCQWENLPSAQSTTAYAMARKIRHYTVDADSHYGEDRGRILPLAIPATAIVKIIRYIIQKGNCCP